MGQQRVKHRDGTLRGKRHSLLTGVLLCVLLAIHGAAGAFHRTDDRPRNPLPRSEVPETAEVISPGKWPGTVKRQEGVFYGEPRAGCRPPACDPGRPDILQAGDLVMGVVPRSTILEETYQVAVDGDRLARIEAALLDEADHVCAGVVEYGNATASRFLFTRSYQSVNEVCQQGDSPCYTSVEQIAAPLDGFYTRIGIDLQVSGLGPFRGSGAAVADGSAPAFSTTVSVVAAQGTSSSSQGTCATYSSTCPDGAACEGMVRTTVSATVTNVRAIYAGQRMCPTNTGSQPKAPGAGSCDLPFAYAPFNDDDATDDDDASTVASCKAAPFCDLDIANRGCFDTPCTPPATLNATLSAVLDEVCGTARDPTTGLTAALNRRCIKAVCGVCTASNKTTASAHRIYAAGPNSAAYRLSTPDRLLADIRIQVDVAAFGGAAAQTRVVQLTNADLNDVVMNEEGDDMVRVTVLGILASAQLVLPDLSGGVLITTDYSGSPGGFIRQSSSISEDPWQALPNRGAGLTPTATNLNSTYGWSYVPAAGRFGNMPGAYGESQYIATSAEANFGTTNSCFSGDPVGEYYDQCRLVPGCDTGSGGTRGIDDPLVTTPCRQTHEQNTITAELLAGTAPADLTYAPERTQPPGYDLLRPPYWVYDNYLVYRLADGDANTLYANATFERPANLYTPGSAEGAAPFVAANTSLADYIVGATTNANQRQLLSGVAAIALTLGVDVSEDLAKYTGASSSAAILRTGTGCGLANLPANGTSTLASAAAIASVENLSSSGTVTYHVQLSCVSLNETITGQPIRVTPSGGLSLTVPHESTLQTAPFSFETQVENTTLPMHHVATQIQCTFTIADVLDPALELDTLTVTCVAPEDGSVGDNSAEDNGGPATVDYEEDDGGDTGEDQSTDANDALLLLFLFLALALVALVIGIVVLTICIKKVA